MKNENSILTNSELESILRSWLTPELFDDYCPNGLQIEGKKEIKKIAFAVSATFDSIEKAVNSKASALIVHHGLFWKFHGAKTITEAFYKRIAPIIKNDINLFGYHLPLDGNYEFGNARALGELIGMTEFEPFGLYKKTFIGIKGKLKLPMTGDELAKHLEIKLQRPPLYSLPDPRLFPNRQTIYTLGIITGGAKDDWNLSLKDGLDAYLTGEMSEHNYHESRESGVTMFAAGHHATEKFGIIALMKKFQTEFPQIETLFIDSENPA